MLPNSWMGVIGESSSCEPPWFTTHNEVPQSPALAVHLHQSGRLRGPELAVQLHQSGVCTNSHQSAGANVTPLAGHTHHVGDKSEALDDL